MNNDEEQVLRFAHDTIIVGKVEYSLSHPETQAKMLAFHNVQFSISWTQPGLTDSNSLVITSQLSLCHFLPSSFVTH